MYREHTPFRLAMVIGVPQQLENRKKRVSTLSLGEVKRQVYNQEEPVNPLIVRLALSRQRSTQR